MTFWILAGLMAALLVMALLWPLTRPRPAPPAAAEYDRTVYRDQLAELEQDRKRGLLNDSEAEAARHEIERRLLQTEAAAAAAAPRAPRSWVRHLALALVVALPPVLGLGLYLRLGTPGLPDMPLAERDPGGAAELAMLAERLKKRVDADPQDIEGRLLLAQVYERSRHYTEAATLYREAIDLVAKQGQVPGVLHAALGESLVAANHGRVVKEARLAFAAAIEADPNNARARYYAGLAMAQDGNLKNAIDVWKSLADDSPADSPWRGLLKEQIARASQELGIEPPVIAEPKAPAGPATAPGTTVSGSPKGPSAADVKAAQEMTPEQRMGFIRSMVAQLAARLDSDPADPDGWLRLARAYTVLGENDKARAALDSAEAQISALPAAAPERAGLTQRLQALRGQIP